jgi:hypothetical protein
MRFSPDGTHLLSGIGANRVFLDGSVPPGLETLLAGGWDWIEGDLIGGNAFWDGQWQLVSYRLSTRFVGPLDLLHRGATNFYGGAGWAAWLASDPPLSFDSEGRTWTAQRCVLARSPEGDEAFCDMLRSVLIVRMRDGTEITRQSGVVSAVRMRDGAILYTDGALRLHAIGEPDPLTPVSGAVPTFVRHPSGERVILSWIPALKTLCLFPWQTTGVLGGYVVSDDEHNYTPDLTVQPDGLLGIGTGENAGETVQRWFEVDWIHKGVRRRGEPTFTSMVPVDLSAPVAPPLPIPSLNKRLWLGGFSFAPTTTFPGNCDFQVHGDGYIRTLDGRPIAQYASGSPDSDIDALEQVIAARKQLDPYSPVVAYWTAAAQIIRRPAGADILGIEAYLHAGESDAAFIGRLWTSAHRGRSWLIPACYSSNANNSTDLNRVAMLCAELARDEITIEGMLVFSGSGRPTGYQDHPDVHATWQAIAASIVGTPSIDPRPIPVPPRPPPDPIPAPTPTPEVIGGTVKLPAGNYAVSYDSAGTLTFTPIAGSGGAAAPSYPDYLAAVEQVRAARAAKGQGPNDVIDGYRLLVEHPMDVDAVKAAI